MLHPSEHIVILLPKFQKGGKSKSTRNFTLRVKRPLDLLMFPIKESFQIRVLCLFISRCLAKPWIYVAVLV